ncbi:MAG: glycosyltransferase family 2 protein [Chlorobiaceae bacterium]|nr:glycosyltransferase family 2 protein [Chlorobiaceae bacterium]
MKTAQPRICIVLLHWKDYNDTKQCLLSLENITYKNYSITIVDNFSNDNSIEKLQAEFPDVKYILNSGNLGFSCGVNAGLRDAYKSGFDYVLVLNNDMVVNPGFLEPAIAIAEKDQKIGAVTGKIMFKATPNIFWHAGGHIDPFRVQGVARGKDEEDRGQYDEICETGWASGAMSLIPRRTFEKVGYFPEEHFFGQEEWDYSTAILRSGLKIIYVPDFKGLHEVGGSYNAGHPILNVYGGYLSKMIYAEKYMSPIAWKIWRIAFWVYLKFKWPILAREGCKCEEDYRVRFGAGLMAFKDHKTIKRVDLAQLENAARRLGPAPSWGNDWVSES